jgi:hypothetical protein
MSSKNWYKPPKNGYLNSLPLHNLERKNQSSFGAYVIMSQIFLYVPKAQYIVSSQDTSCGCLSVLDFHGDVIDMGSKFNSLMCRWRNWQINHGNGTSLGYHILQYHRNGPRITRAEHLNSISEDKAYGIDGRAFVTTVAERLCLSSNVSSVKSITKHAAL